MKALRRSGRRESDKYIGETKILRDDERDAG